MKQTVNVEKVYFFNISDAGCGDMLTDQRSEYIFLKKRLD